MNGLSCSAAAAEVEVQQRREHPRRAAGRAEVPGHAVDQTRRLRNKQENAGREQRKSCDSDRKNPLSFRFHAFSPASRLQFTKALFIIILGCLCTVNKIML